MIFKLPGQQYQILAKNDKTTTSFFYFFRAFFQKDVKKHDFSLSFSCDVHKSFQTWSGYISRQTATPNRPPLRRPSAKMFSISDFIIIIIIIIILIIIIMMMIMMIMMMIKNCRISRISAGRSKSRPDVRNLGWNFGKINETWKLPLKAQTRAS